MAKIDLLVPTVSLLALASLACGGSTTPPAEAPVVTPAPLEVAPPPAAPVAEAPAAAPAPAPAPKLDVSTDYKDGARSFELTNHSTREYTGLRLTINGSYSYALKRLPAGSSDSIRLVSFISRSSGQELTAKEGVKRLHIDADQGSWDHSY